MTITDYLVTAKGPGYEPSWYTEHTLHRSHFVPCSFLKDHFNLKHKCIWRCVFCLCVFLLCKEACPFLSFLIFTVCTDLCEGMCVSERQRERERDNERQQE